MLRAGRLGDQAQALGEREFRTGDRVLCRQNDPHLGVRNGTRATVVARTDTGLRLRTDTGAMRQIPHAYAATHLDHGYALTGHAAQGATVQRAFVLLHDQAALREWGYVACSRARVETRLYLATHELQPDIPAHPHERSTSDRAARALTTTAAQPLARDKRASTDPATMRALARRERQLAQIRARAEQRLAEAEPKLKGLGRLRRGTRRAGLRTEIALQRRAIQLADDKITDPAATTRQRVAAVENHRDAPERQRHAPPRTSATIGAGARPRHRTISGSELSRPEAARFLESEHLRQSLEMAVTVEHCNPAVPGRGGRDQRVGQRNTVTAIAPLGELTKGVGLLDHLLAGPPRTRL